MTELVPHVNLNRMRYDLKRLELGRMFIDVAKYIATIIVVGSLFSEKVNLRVVVIGIILSLVVGIIGFLTIPVKEDQ